MIHKGHIDLSKVILNHSSDYNEVWLTPCYQHLYGKELVDAEHRLEMCKIAAQVDARIKVFDYEIHHKFQGETYGFMKKLINDSEYKDKYCFSLAIGLDNANTIEKWSNYEDLIRLVSFVVIKREGYTFDASWCLNSPHRYIEPDVSPLDISSTNLRGMFERCDKDVCKFLNQKVYEYILSKSLYQKKTK